MTHTGKRERLCKGAGMSWTKRNGVWICADELNLYVARIWPIGDQGWQAQSTSQVGVHSEMEATPREALISLVEEMDKALARVKRVAESWDDIQDDFGGDQ